MAERVNDLRSETGRCCWFFSLYNITLHLMTGIHPSPVAELYCFKHTSGDSLRRSAKFSLCLFRGKH